MARLAKALKRLQAKPANFTWDELVTVMQSFGYEVKTGSGSSRIFLHPGTMAVLMMHEPHPAAILKTSQLRAVLKFLAQEKHL